MRIVERFALILFSLIILVLGTVLFCALFGWLDAIAIVKAVMYYVLGSVTIYRVVLIADLILLLLAIKALFFPGKVENLSKDGLVLENASGKLVISRESLESLVASVAREIPGAESVTSRTFLDKDRNLKVYVTTSISRDMTLKGVSTELQDKIKEAMKKTADLDVKEVNIRVKNITSKKIKSKSKNEKDKKVTPEVPAEEPVQTVTEDESNEEVKTEGEE